jgi:hypothetical protein
MIFAANGTMDSACIWQWSINIAVEIYNKAEFMVLMLLDLLYRI